VTWRRNKSFFASFFSKKEDSSFSEEKEARRLLFLVLREVACRAIVNGAAARGKAGRAKTFIPLLPRLAA
jgi:hypothetical protein